jgi:hypothetical protein
VTTAMSASDAALTPSRKAPASGEARSFGYEGTTQRDEDERAWKMFAIATNAPLGPAST